MSEWKGFDSGGTEQLWEPAVLIDMLTVVKSHEPFSRNDPNSPIFDDLENLYPDITWKNINADGSFRPIFRKTNPLVKLGLTSTEPSDATVLPFGDDLLAGVVSVNEVFISTAKLHRETDGTPSMVIMCAAAIEAPTETFTLVDIELGVSREYDPSISNLNDVLSNIRTSRVVFPDNSSVRKRRLRNFMNALVITGALKEVVGGWILDNEIIARDIASNFTQTAITQSSTPISAAEVSPITSRARKRTRAPSAIRSISSGERRQITVSASVESISDPVQRALLLERANNTHEQLVGIIADIIRSNGSEPLEDPNSFDVAVENPVEAIIEVKTINQNNCIAQIRKALAQLPEYRWKHRDRFPTETKQILVLDKDPRDFIDDEYMEYIQEDREVIVIWQTQDRLIDQNNQNLSEILFPSC